MKNYAKMEPKWEPESMQNQEKADKKACQKSMLKFDAEKRARPFFDSRFLIDFWSGLAGLGDTRIQAKTSG